MKPFSLKESVLFSYRSYAHFLRRTFLAHRGTQARMTPKRLAIMLPFFIALLVLQTMHWIAFVADEILFAGYKSVEIRRPLFIVGVPRSGTTFLHRLLSEDRDTFVTFSLWELILAPSIAERKIIHGLASLDRRIGSPIGSLVRLLERTAFSGLDDIHGTSLSDPEEDYLTLLPVYACFLMILPFPFPEDLGHLAFFDDQTPDQDQERIMAFYKTCLQRHLYVHGTGRTLLSKNVSFGPMLETLTRVFPDARVVGTVRDPLSAVPSHISAMLEGAAFFDNDTRGDAFRDQMIDVQRYAYTHLAEVLPRLPRERRVLARMEDLHADLAGVVRRIYARFGLTVTPAFSEILDHRARIQKTYRSRHRYDPARYNLSAAEIFRRFHDVYPRFGYRPPPDSRRGKENHCRRSGIHIA